MKKLILIFLMLTGTAFAEQCPGTDFYTLRVILDKQPMSQTLRDKISDLACDAPTVVTERHACSNKPDLPSSDGSSINCNLNSDCPGGTCVKKRLVDIILQRKVQVQKFLDCMGGDTSISPLCSVNYIPQPVRLWYGLPGTPQSDILYTTTNKNRYLRILPDVCTGWTGTSPDNMTCDSWIRPSAPYDIHKFAGHPDKDMVTTE